MNIYVVQFTMRDYEESDARVWLYDSAAGAWAAFADIVAAKTDQYRRRDLRWNAERTVLATHGRGVQLEFSVIAYAVNSGAEISGSANDSDPLCEEHRSELQSQFHILCRL